MFYTFYSSLQIKQTLCWFLRTFTSRFINYICVTVTWPPHIHRTISTNYRKSHSDLSTDHFICTLQTENRPGKKGMSLNRLRLKSICDDFCWKFDEYAEITQQYCKGRHDRLLIVWWNKLSCVDSLMNINLDLNYRQKQNSRYELKRFLLKNITLKLQTKNK